MAAPDTTGIKETVATKIYTDTSINGKKPDAKSFRETYGEVIDWVKSSIINASPWRKISDGTGSVDESDTVYRSGRTIIGGSQDDGTESALQVRGTASIDGLFANNGDGVQVPTVARPGQGVMRFVANLIPGLSNFSFVNANIKSQVTDFYYAIDGNFLRLVLMMRQNRVGIGGIIQPQETLDVDGRTRTYGLVGSGGKPTAAVLGTGLGTSGSIAMDATATDAGGRFAITTGSNPTMGQMARINFASPFARVPAGIMFCHADPDAAQHVGKILLYPESASSMVLTGTPTGTLPANTKLEYNYIIIG